MKTQHNNLLSQLNSKELVSLTTVVKETIALDVQVNNRVFSAADLWKIQNSRRVRVARRMFA
ncbi:MAG: hypothetical protein MUE72_03890 [Chitinophagaceae bacterium]|jgi:hypothetical protein|nr:hypothetical protein [Chitinophagaceae bacterium]